LASPSGKQNIKNRLYDDALESGIDQTVHGLVQTFSTIRLPLYLLPSSFFNQPVAYQNFFNTILSPYHGLNLQTCQNAKPTVNITSDFQCEETRQGA